MNRWLIIFVVLIAGCASSPKYEVLVNNLDVPWAIALFSHDSFLFTERDTGKVYHYDNGQVKHIGTMPIAQVSESGLLGIAIDPDFGKNNYVYVYYTYAGNETHFNRVSRLTYDGALKNEQILVDAIPGAQFHDGGRIEFGDDNKLYIATGDARKPDLAQDLNSPAGKILRINPDGTIPKDNPFPGLPVYSYGHRNVQGLAWLAGRLFATEHGPSMNDEINRITPGKNYGWPEVQCTAHEGYEAPIRCFDDFTLAPGGATFDDTNNLYVAGLRGSQVRKFNIHDNKVASEEVFLDGLGRIREVKYHMGWLYIATSNQDGRGVPRPGDDKIIRLLPR